MARCRFQSYIDLNMGKHGGKIALLALLAALFAAFWALGLNRYFTLSFLKSSSGAARTVYAAHPVLAVAGYFALYVLCAALSVPGAVVLTIAAGGLFGLVAGTLLTSFASAIGATIACFLSRYLLRSWVQKKLGRRVNRIDEGVDKEGALYLFTLRLIPIFPFWMINLAMGLTTMPLRRFYWVSQLGMLPGEHRLRQRGAGACPHRVAQRDTLAGPCDFLCPDRHPSPGGKEIACPLPGAEECGP